MRIGYLHVGRRDHGVTRYGYLLAEAAGAYPDLTVVAIDLDLTMDRRRTWKNLWRAAKELGKVDVVHIQYNNQADKSIWGRRWLQFEHLWRLTALIDTPLVVTVHDVYERSTWPGLWRFAFARLRLAGARRSRKAAQLLASALPVRFQSELELRRDVNRNVEPDGLALWWLQRRAQLLLVCSDEERRRVHGFLPSARTRVIPHFVENRSRGTNAAAAKRALGLTAKIVTLLGYIHPRKGHELLIEAMQHLPPDVTVVFAGAAEADHMPFRQRLEMMARKAGVAERLRITGYLSERDLDLYLAATDLAVCPFTAVSASGSLSTWISAGTPILASDLPLIAEYNHIEPNAIHTFAPYTAAALAEEVCNLLRSGSVHQNGPLVRLRDRLSIRSVFEQHLEVYKAVAGDTARRKAPRLRSALAIAPDNVAVGAISPHPKPASAELDEEVSFAAARSDPHLHTERPAAG